MGAGTYVKCDGPGCKRRKTAPEPSHYGRSTVYHMPKGWYFIESDGRNAFCSKQCHEAWWRAHQYPDY